MDEEQKSQRRISNVTAVLMVIVAVVLDLINLIPVVGVLVGNILALLIFGLWYLMLGIPIMGARQFARWGTSWLIDTISVGYLPGITLGAILIIVVTRTEDKTGISLIDKVKPTSAGTLKNARRAANPERTLQARDRLERRLARRAQESEGAATKPKEHPQIKDINYPKAA
ncbi:MAG: hypothetical protein AAB458_02575 [Patescibacteria group bacterium]